MKLLAVVFAVMMFTHTVFGMGPLPGKKTYDEYERELVLSQVKPVPVFAKINRAAPLYASQDSKSRVIKTLEADSDVEILRDSLYKWYFVSLGEGGTRGWVKREVLDIPDDKETNENKLSKYILEAYVNISDFASDTEYLVWTDIDRQFTYVFMGCRNAWKLSHTINSSTGKNVSPTTRGLFKISERGTWFYNESLKSGAKYWVRFNGAYLYHSLPMDKNKVVTDETLGKMQSSGCIRMSLADAEWFYKNMPEGTTVFVN